MLVSEGKAKILTKNGYDSVRGKPSSVRFWCLDAGENPSYILDRQGESEQSTPVRPRLSGESRRNTNRSLWILTDNLENSLKRILVLEKRNNKTKSQSRDGEGWRSHSIVGAITDGEYRGV